MTERGLEKMEELKDCSRGCWWGSESAGKGTRKAGRSERKEKGEVLGYY